MNACRPARVISILLVLYFSILAVPITAQKLEYVQGELLVKLRPGHDIQQWARNFSLQKSRPFDLKIRRRIGGPLEIYRCAFDFARFDENEVLAIVRRHPAVEAAQFDHFLALRTTTPNDPDFPMQWFLFNNGQRGTAGVDLGLTRAWDITTGGLSAAGDTIVVCVIDDGITPAHRDIGDNLWVNYGEIPGNGEDDDGNGFVDDYYGWNAYTQNDNVQIDQYHGTNVAGIIGARGNNQLGVSGINWNVKLMIVVGGSGRESEALESYSYALSHRRRYNETNGQEGAFVVATNASWGVNFGNPQDFPLWCSFYDALGSAGILNVAATANLSINVDELGDMPTGCPSDFLIGVTNANADGQLMDRAGFGARNIDLAGFGDELWTTTPPDNYGAFPGTSAAAPNVSGAIALLYAAPCPTLMAISHSDPAAATLLIRDYLFDGVIKDPSLEGKTATGGRLNIYNSLRLLMDNCGDCSAPTSPGADQLTATEATLTWNATDSVRSVDLRWRAVGSENWNVVRNARSPYQLSELEGCREYEFQLQTYCSLDTIPFGDSFFFTTDGCCVAPDGLRTGAVGETVALLQWNSVLAAERYQLRYRQRNAEEWRVITSRQTNFFINNLLPCTRYEVQMLSLCGDEQTGYGPTFAFTTLGCGACVDRDYCLPLPNNASAEWIAEVAINTLENFSASDRGYGNFTGFPSTELQPGATYDIRLKAGFPGTDSPEYFQVWIDYNQDGIFSASELAFDPGGASRQEVSGQVTIPADAPPGRTRLRVAMQFLTPGGPCNLSGQRFGEIEDYCVTITEEPTPCDEPLEISATSETDRARITWTDPGNSREFLLSYRSAESESWISLPYVTNPTVLEGLSACTDYEVLVKSVCGDNSSLFSAAASFRTDCSTATEDPAGIVAELRIYPQPAGDQLTVALVLQEAQTGLLTELYDITGQRIIARKQDLPQGRQQINLSLEDLPAGIYLLRISNGKGMQIIKKVIRGTK